MTQSNLPQTSTGNQSESQIARKMLINDLLGTLKVNYSMFMDGQPENETKRHWETHLAPFTDAQIQQAKFDVVDHITHHRGPTVGDFKKIIRSNSRPENQVYHKALPPPQNVDVAADHLGRMRLALGMRCRQ